MTTEAKWAARVKAWRESGQTADGFAVGKEFAAGTLRWWASRLARRDRVPMARVIRRPASEAASPAEAGALAIEVTGARIAVGRGFDAELLRDVVSALGGRR